MNNVSFLDRVRAAKSDSNHISNPTQIDFSLSKWTDAFVAYEAPSIEDVRLYEAGLWFNKEFTAIRHAMLNVSDQQTQVLTDRRFLVAYMHLLWTQIQQHSNDLAQQQPHLINTYGMYIDANLTKIVDSLRFPLSESKSAIRAAPESYTSAFLDLDEAWSRALDYDSLYHLWLDCLWDGWYLAEADEFSCFFPPDIEKEKRRFARDLRMQNTLSEFAMRATITLKQITEVGNARLIASLLYIPLATKASVEEGIIQFRVDNRQASSEDEMGMVVQMLAAREFYLKEVLEEKRKALRGLTLNDIFKVWSLISSIISKTELPQAQDVQQNPDLCLNLCPLIDRTMLLRAIKSSLSFDHQQAETVLTAFIHVGKLKDDAFLLPLIEVDERFVAPLFPALLYPNLVRSLEHWMKLGKVDLSVRGGLFEAHARSYLAERNKLKTVEVLNKSLNFKVAKNSFEQIDLVIKIGKSVLICEIKCSIVPTSPYAHYEYRNTLKGAAEQARRKAEFARQHKQQFIEQLIWRELDGNDIKILPVVITNLPVGSGLEFAGVPVTDLLLLGKYLSDEPWTMMGSLNVSGEENGGTSMKFYTTEEEAQDRIGTYLMDPPQVLIYEASLEPTSRPVFSRGNRPIHLLQFVPTNIENLVQIFS